MLAGLLALGCTGSLQAPDPPPQRDRFTVCYGHGCARLATVGLTAAEWAALQALFQPAPTHAAEERRRLARAIALLEQAVGAKTGTAADLAGTFPGFGRSGQMDCIDESTNTTTYLYLLARAGLLRWHAPDATVTRGFLASGWPHTTAVIRERAADTRYAVDSWFHDNGAPAEIVPLAEWRRGWRPERP